MFGHRYFGARYFGPRYWGEAGTGAAAAEIPVSRGGIDYREVEKSHRIDRAREQAREAARQAAEDLRRSLERAFTGRTEDGEETTAPAVRRAVKKAGERFAAATANDFGIEAEAVAALRAAIRELLTKERLARLAVERIAREAERIATDLFDDDEDAIAALLIAMN